MEGSCPWQWFSSHAHSFFPLFNFLSSWFWQEIISASIIENIWGKNHSWALTKWTIGYKKLLLIFKHHVNNFQVYSYRHPLSAETRVCIFQKFPSSDFLCYDFYIHICVQKSTCKTANNELLKVHFYLDRCVQAKSDWFAYFSMPNCFIKYACHNLCEEFFEVLENEGN